MKRRASLEHLEQHATAHAVDWTAIDLHSPIDRTRPFLCETLTPLYYSDIYAELNCTQALRYNQLTGMSYNEVISFFEVHFAQNILNSLIARRHGLDPRLIEAMIAFAEEERRHTEAFRALNRLSEPEEYRKGDHWILQPTHVGRYLVRSMTRRPEHFPVVLWIALVMEERSLFTSRALLLKKDEIEPHYLAVYKAHLQDEVRHVHIDWHLLERLYASRSPFFRQVNAQLFVFALKHFFLAPMRAGQRVVELLLREHPELEPKRRRLIRALRGLKDNREYHSMMYSRQVIPIAFQLFDRFIEFRGLDRVLTTYEPVVVHRAENLLAKKGKRS